MNTLFVSLYALLLSLLTMVPLTQLVVAFGTRRFPIKYFHQCSKLSLNRFLFDPSEIISDKIPPLVILAKDDYRTIHASKILNLHNGDSLRAGVVQDAEIKTPQDSISIDLNCTKANHNFAGQITDTATIEWLPEGKIKKAEPTKNGDPPGSLKITLHDLIYLQNNDTNGETSLPHVSLILALPRPLALSRLLPMIAQMGVHDLILTSAAKVPKDYFGSHLFRNPMLIRSALIEGLCQACDVKVPRVTVVKRLKPFLEDDLERMFPANEYCRVIAHPQRKDGPKVLKMSQVKFPNNKDRKIVVAVGPEGGWSEPYELDMFQTHGFQQTTLGPRILRSDVAVISLLSQAQSAVSEQEVD